MIYPFAKTVYNCRQATLLSIKKAEGKITPFERVKLRYHLMFCDPCRRFIDQWDMLDQSKKSLPLLTLSDESKIRIEKRIQEENRSWL